MRPLLPVTSPIDPNAIADLVHHVLLRSIFNPTMSRYSSPTVPQGSVPEICRHFRLAARTKNVQLLKYIVVLAELLHTELGATRLGDWLLPLAPKGKGARENASLSVAIHLLHSWQAGKLASWHATISPPLTGDGGNVMTDSRQ